MSAIAERAGLSRESLYMALAPGAKPRYDTVLIVLQSLGAKPCRRCDATRTLSYLAPMPCRQSMLR